MKKIILVFIIAFFVTFTQAQENKFAANRADNAVSLITKNMQISDSNITFLRETLYNKYASNASKIRGKNLTEDEKKTSLSLRIYGNSQKIDECFYK